MADEPGNKLNLDLCYGCGTCFVLTSVLFFVAAESSCTRSFSAIAFQVVHFILCSLLCGCYASGRRKNTMAVEPNVIA